MSNRTDRRRGPARPGARPDIDDILKGMNWDARMEEARAKRARILAAKERYEPARNAKTDFEHQATPELINEMSDPVSVPDSPKPAAEPFVLTAEHATRKPVLKAERPERVSEQPPRVEPPIARPEPGIAQEEAVIDHSVPLTAPKRSIGRARPEVEALIAPKRARRKRSSTALYLGVGLALGAGAALLATNRLEVLIAGDGPQPTTAASGVASSATVSLTEPLAIETAVLARAVRPPVPRPVDAAPVLVLAQASPNVASLAPALPGRVWETSPISSSFVPHGLVRSTQPVIEQPAVPGITPVAETVGALAFAQPPVPVAQVAAPEPSDPTTTAAALAPDNGTAPSSLPPISLRLSVPAGVSEATLERVTSALNAAGYQPDGATRVTYAVSQNHVRYYHPEDAQAAALIAQALGGPARDFTTFTPSPRLGTLEAFLAGSAPVAATNTPLQDIEDVLQGLFQRIRQEEAGASAGN